MVLENKIDRFIGKVELGKSFFEDAALLLVQMIDEEPDVCERIVAMNRVPWMTRDVLATFESIGRKQLAVEAMFLPRHVLNRMLTLPVAEQARIATEPLRICNGAPRRRTDVVIKPAAQLTRREAELAIGPNGLRTVEEQRAVVIDPVVEKPVERVVGCFEVTVMNGKAFLKRCEHAARAQRVKLDGRGQAIVEFVY